MKNSDFVKAKQVNEINQFFQKAIRSIILYLIITPLTPWVYLLLKIKFPNDLCLVNERLKLKTIKSNENYSNFNLINQTILPCLRYYVGKMEFQQREGYCGPTTVRNLLFSLNGIKLSLPPLKSGPLDAEKVKEMIDKSTHGRTKTRIVYGDLGYAKFLDGIRASNNEHCRVTINFLRGALFGSWPHTWLLAALGGHFSNVLGYLEELNLVVIFDVNQEYGLFLVDAHRLYTSVLTPDFSFSKTKSRAILITEIVD